MTRPMIPAPSERTRVFGMALAGVAFFASAALLPSTALAWKHIDDNPYLWHPDDLPVQYCLPPSDHCEETLGDPEYCGQMMEEAHQAWYIGAPCASLGGGVQSECEPTACLANNEHGDEDGMCTNYGFTLSDPRNTVGFNDPHNELEVGVLGANLTYRPSNAYQILGQMYKWVDNSDIVFNDDVAFATHEDVMSGQCQGRSNMLAVATHEVGHLYGMGHSCDQFEACNDADLRGAVMFWSSPQCETTVDIQSDDIEGINALYGPSATFNCNGDSSASQFLGVVPFELNCEVDADEVDDIVETRWTLGDGTVLDAENMSHVYTEPGSYTVELRVTGQRDTCESAENADGLWESTFRKVGFVVVCDVPEAAFTIHHYDGLTYELQNETDVRVYGCINDIEWQVYEGTDVSGEPIRELTRKAWEPRITFPDEGTYTIVANIGGPAGTGAAKLTIDAKDRRGEGQGCSHVGLSGAAGSSLAFLALGLMAAGRRRD